MGLDGFLSFVKKKYPDVLKEEHISKYSNQFIFFDISSYIYKYICIFGNQDGRWLNAMLNLFLLFKTNHINIIPVFDGKPPDEKKDEIAERKEKRNKIKDKISFIKNCISKFTDDEEFTQEEQEQIAEILKKLDDKGSSTKLKRLLFKDKNESRVLSDSDIQDLQNYIMSLERQMVYIGEKDTAHLKDLLDILGVPFTVSPSESEGYCCSMIKKGIGSAIISCDTDCFAHGANEVVLSLDVQSGMITYINLKELLEEMELTQEQFVDFGILIGCDYNKKNKLPKVGPVKALELIKKYKSIDAIEGYDISVLNHKEIRKLFNLEYKPIKTIKQNDINEDALFNFIDDHNLKVGRERILKIINDLTQKSEIVFID